MALFEEALRHGAFECSSLRVDEIEATDWEDA